MRFAASLKPDSPMHRRLCASGRTEADVHGTRFFLVHGRWSSWISREPFPAELANDPSVDIAVMTGPAPTAAYVRVG